MSLLGRSAPACASGRVQQQRNGRRLAISAALNTGPTPTQPLQRRAALGLLSGFVLASQPGAAQALLPPIIKPELAPNEAAWDPTDERLQLAANMLQEALNVENVVEEEFLWTRMIKEFSELGEAPWVPEVLGRAYGNRGNARSRQGKMQQALDDYEKAMNLCPWSVDPVLNRGVVLEAMGRFDDAITDYKAILKVSPGDPAAWNNLGNASAGLGQWKEAESCYSRAMSMAPGFSFAFANHAVAMYQLGSTEQSIKEMRSLLRKYPTFSDMRAALAAALWSEGLEAQAEENWLRMDDPRYKDLKWVATNRRWPPRLVQALDDLIHVKSSTSTNTSLGAAIRRDASNYEELSL